MLVILLAAQARAHNSWVVTDRCRVDAGDDVRAAFVTGHDAFPVSEHATDPARVASWLVQHRGERSGVTGYAIEEQDLAAHVELKEKGLHTVAVALHPRLIELAAEDFNGYLEEEHATAALDRRRRDGTLGEPGRELYTKLGKTFVQVGPIEPVDASDLAAVGHPLEIIPLTSPIEWTAGDDVRVRVLRNGKPARGLHVSTGHETTTGHDYVQTTRTDERGEVTLTMDRPGHWYIRTHVIQPVEHADADWESFWASLTVQVPRAPAGAPKARRIDPDDSGAR